MSLASRGENKALRRVLDEGLNEAPVFNSFLDKDIAAALLTIGHDKKISTMAHSIVRTLREAGCIADVYLAFNENGGSLTGDVETRVRVSFRGEEPTNAPRIAAYTYTQLAP